MNSTCSHSPAGPLQPSERQLVRGSPSNAAYGCRPGSRIAGGAVTSEEAEEAVIAFTPSRRAAAAGPRHAGSRRSAVRARSPSGSVAPVLRRTSP